MKDFFLKNKKIILIAAAVAVALIVGIVIACVVGGNNPDTPDQTEPGSSVNYSVLIQNKAGEPIGNVKVFVYSNFEKEEMIWAAVTDGTGKISFDAPESDEYVAVIENVPAAYGYDEVYSLKEQQITIVLKDLLLNDTDMNMEFALGDSMMDFSVLDCDGVEYQLSALLQEKKAVVLNFWYLNCGPCKMEFPYLQEAYGMFSSDVAVLALNPMDGDDASVAQFRNENGLTFAMAKVDEKWANIKWAGEKISAYPTTIVIDREGKISMIHKGMVTDTQTFLNVFGYYTAEDYTSKVVNSVEELPVYEIKNSAENPLEISGVTSFNVTVKPGEKMYVNVYNVADMLMEIISDHVFVEYNGLTYNVDKDGVRLLVDAPNPFTPVSLVIGNSGTEEETYTVNFTYPEGSMGNPYQLQMGQFTAQIPAGHDTGMYYTFTALQPGKLMIKLIKASKGVEYDVAVTNKTTMSSLTLGEDAVDGVITMDVNTGDVIEISVGTFMDMEGKFPAADIKLEAAFDDGGLAAPMDYTVTVKDDSGAAVPNVSIKITGENVNQTLKTDKNGVVTVNLPAGEYTCTVTVPSGYKAATTKYKLSETVDKVTATIEKEQVQGGNTEPKPPVQVGDPEVPGETAENPIDFWTASEGEVSADITIRSGWKAYLRVNRIFNMYLQIKSDNVQVIYNGETYKPKNGKVSVYINAKTAFDLLDFQVVNTGSSAETFTLKFVSPAGSYMNPYDMEMGKFSVKVPEGSEDGVYYSYTATKSGTLTITCTSASTKDYNFSLYNRSTSVSTKYFAQESGKLDAEGNLTLSVEVKAGDLIELNVVMIPDQDFNYPAGSFQFEAELN